MITTELDSTSRLYSQINASTDQMDKCTGECDIKKEKMKTLVRRKFSDTE